MGIFGDKKKSVDRKPYRKPSDEEIEKLETRKEKQRAREKFYDLAKNDPELEKQWISKQMGIDIKSLDPAERQKREIKTIIVNRALDKIKEDPELAEQFVETQIQEIVGEGRRRGRHEEYGGEYPSGNLMSQVLEEIDGYETLKERFGGKGALGGLLTPEVMTEVVKTLGALIQQRGGVTPAERTVVVSVNGELKEVTASEYQKLLQEGRLKPVAALMPPKEEKPSKEKVAEEKPIDISQFLSLVDLDVLVTKLEYTPEAYVYELQAEVEAGDMQAKFLWGILSSMTIDEIIEKVTPLKESEELKLYIEKLLSEEGKAWLTEVVRIIVEIKTT